LFLQLPEAAEAEIKRVEELLAKHNPWPGRELDRLAQLAAATPEGEERYATFRRVVLDIDGLLQDCRWQRSTGLASAPVGMQVSRLLSLGLAT
jgi:hypothetical protein